MQLDEGNPNPQPLSMNLVMPEVFPLMIAGSDTTATVLTTACYFLVMKPEVFNRWVPKMSPLNMG